MDLESVETNPSVQESIGIFQLIGPHNDSTGPESPDNDSIGQESPGLFQMIEEIEAAVDKILERQVV
jgi:hypothetical protein